MTLAMGGAARERGPRRLHAVCARSETFRSSERKGVGMITATMANSPLESRNFPLGGQHALDEIAELSLCMKVAKLLKVNLHVFCYEGYPEGLGLHRKL